MKEIIMDDTTGFYLFLLVKKGNDVVKTIHKKLNEDLLFSYRPNFLNAVEFKPHMTLGHFDKKEDLLKAYHDVSDITELFETTVNKISVEIIEENNESLIEFEVSLEP